MGLLSDLDDLDEVQAEEDEKVEKLEKKDLEATKSKVGFDSSEGGLAASDDEEEVRQRREALEDMWDERVEAGAMVDSELMTDLVQAAAEDGLAEAERWMNRTLKAGARGTMAVYDFLITAAGAEDNAEAAQRWEAHARAAAVRLGGTTYHTLAKVTERHGDLSQSRWYAEKAAAKGIHIEVAGGTGQGQHKMLDALGGAGLADLTAWVDDPLWFDSTTDFEQDSSLHMRMKISQNLLYLLRETQDPEELMKSVRHFAFSNDVMIEEVLNKAIAVLNWDQLQARKVFNWTHIAKQSERVESLFKIALKQPDIEKTKLRYCHLILAFGGVRPPPLKKIDEWTEAAVREGDDFFAKEAMAAVLQVGHRAINWIPMKPLVEKWLPRLHEKLQGDMDARVGIFHTQIFNSLSGVFARSPESAGLLKGSLGTRERYDSLEHWYNVTVKSHIYATSYTYFLQLMRAAAHCGEYEIAEKWYREAIEKDQVSPELTGYLLLAATYSSKAEERSEAIQQALDVSQEAGNPVNSQIISFLIRTLCKLRDCRAADMWFTWAEQGGTAEGVTDSMWHSMVHAIVDAVVNADQEHLPKVYLERARAAGLRDCMGWFTAQMRVAAFYKNLTAVVDLLDASMVYEPRDDDLWEVATFRGKIWNMALLVAGRCGDKVLAQEWYLKANREGQHRVANYLSLINAGAMAHDLEFSERWFDTYTEVHGLDMQPETAYSIMLKAASNSGQYSRLQYWYKVSDDLGFTRKNAGLVAMMARAYAKAGDIAMTEHFVDTFSKNGFPPSAGVHGARTLVYAKNGDVAMVHKIIQDMPSEGVLPGPFHYNHLLLACQIRGKCKDFAESVVRFMVQEAKLKPDTLTLKTLSEIIGDVQALLLFGELDLDPTLLTSRSKWH